MCFLAIKELKITMFDFEHKESCVMIKGHRDKNVFPKRGKKSIVGQKNKSVKNTLARRAMNP